MYSPQDVDFELLATETDEQLKSLGDEWMARLDQTDQTDPQNRFRTGLLRLAYSYARLVALSFGFQHAFGKNGVDENPFLERVCQTGLSLYYMTLVYAPPQCLAAAYDVVDTYVHDVGRPAQRKLALCVVIMLTCMLNIRSLDRHLSSSWTRSTKCIRYLCLLFSRQGNDSMTCQSSNH